MADLNQLAACIVRQATEDEPCESPQRASGRAGGLKRAARPARIWRSIAWVWMRVTPLTINASNNPTLTPDAGEKNGPNFS